jgi:hypothetical protein
MSEGSRGHPCEGRAHPALTSSAYRPAIWESIAACDTGLLWAVAIGALVAGNTRARAMSRALACARGSPRGSFACFLAIAA